MKISAIKSVNFNAADKTVVTVSYKSHPENRDDSKNSDTKKIAYVAGAVILAGLGAYVFRKELGLVKKIKQEIPNHKPEPVHHEPNIGGGSSSNAGGDKNVPPVNPFQWIIDFNKSKLEEVKGIIDGYVGRLDGKFLKTMERKALQTANGSSKKPLHEAANLLEQTYITQFLRGDASQKEGLDFIFSRMKGENTLVSIYTHMPFKEFTARLENLKTNEFAAQSHIGMTPEKFVNKVTRLVKNQTAKRKTAELAIAGRYNEAAEHLESYYAKRYQQIQNPTTDDLKRLVTSIMKDPSSHLVYGIEGNASRLYNLNKKYFGSKLDPKTAKKVVDETFAQSLLQYTMKALEEGAADSKIEIFKPASAPSMKNFIKYQEKPTAWLVEFNNKKMDEAARIISENGNLHGNDYLNMMEKIAMDFSHDQNREKPLHEAANFLEQAYLRHYLKGDTKIRIGIDKMFDRIQVNDKLMSLYRQMPVEEAVARLNNLKLTALKADKYTGISAEKFVDKVGRLLIQQNMRKETSQLLAAGKADEAAAVLENYYAMRLLKSEKNTPEDYKRFVQAIVNDKEFAAIYKNEKNNSAPRIFTFNEKYFNSELNPETANEITSEILDKIIIKTANKKVEPIFKDSKMGEALGIDSKGIYDKIMRSNQDLRKSTQEILNGLKDNNGRVKLSELDAKARELMNQGKTTEAAFLMEQSILEYYKFGAVETPIVYGTAARIEQSTTEALQEAIINRIYTKTEAPSTVKLSPNFEQLKNSILSDEGKTLFEIYSRLPKEEAAQRFNVFKRNYLTSNFSNVSVKDTDEFYKQVLSRING